MLKESDITLLESCFLFSSASKEEIISFTESDFCTVSLFSKGETVFGGENTVKRLGILLSGKATALCKDCSKSSLKVFSSGELFGAASVFCSDCKEPFSKIEALSSCRVLFITKTGVEKLIYSKPERAVEYIRFLSGRVEFLNRRISTFTAKETLSRVAEYFLNTSDENGVCKNVNFSALAKSLDISRASLYRAKGELINLKTIETEGKNVILLDREALKNIP